MSGQALKDINKTLSSIGWQVNTDSTKAKTLAIEDKKSLPADCTGALAKAKDKLNDLLSLGKKSIQALKDKQTNKPEDAKVSKTSLSE